jgi:hypothetical protein
MAFFNVLSFAQTPQAKSDPAKARDTVAKALEAHGLTVVADEHNPSSMEFFIADDFVDLTFKEDGIDVTVNGKPVSRKLKITPHLDSRMSGVEAQQEEEEDVNLIECLLAAVDIYFLQLDICEFQSEGVDFLCLPEATFDLALNILRCVGHIED